LRQLASRHGISVYVALLAPYLVLLQRLTGQSLLSVGAPMPGRSKEWHSTVGFFANTVVLRAELTAQTRVADLLKQLRGTLWRALKNQAYPYSVLMEQLRPQRDQREHPFFQVWFNHQNARIESDLVTLLTPIDRSARVQCGDLLLRPFGEWSGAGGPGLDFLLETVEVGDQIRVDLNYNAGRFEHATMQRYLGYWRRLIEAMVANDEELIDRLPMLGEAERQQLLYDWNPAISPYPEPLCVHERFEAQVRRAAELSRAECTRQSVGALSASCRSGCR
jgi:non-ribosomal peptide synthetase component F